MKNLIVLISLLFSVIGYSQKPLSEYTFEELNQEKMEAVKVEDYSKAAIYKKAIELKGQLDKAVLAEDYDGAANLKDELNNLFNAAKAPINTPAVTTTATKNLVEVINYSESDIYSDDFDTYWMGLDFSLFKLTDIKFLGRDDELSKYIPAWQKIFLTEIPMSTLQRWFYKRNFKDYRLIGQAMYNEHLNSTWISTEANSITEDDITVHLKNYPLKNSGIGLVFMVENLNKTNKVMSGYFVWFNMTSKEIILSERVSGRPSHGSMSSYWGKSFIPATKLYIDYFYKKERAKTRATQMSSEVQSN
jgi:hypothetical protein